MVVCGCFLPAVFPAQPVWLSTSQRKSLISMLSGISLCWPAASFISLRCCFTLCRSAVDPSKTVAALTATGWISIIFAVVLLFLLLKFNLLAEVQRDALETIRFSLSFIKVEFYEDIDLKLARAFLITAFRMLAVVSLINSTLAFRLSTLILSRLGYRVNALPLFKNWQFSRYFDSFCCLASSWRSLLDLSRPVLGMRYWIFWELP